MIIKSHAKINLFLEVLGKNEQNYHLLESLICFVNIFDQITIKKDTKLSLKTSGSYSNFLENDDSQNIILKTIGFMAKKFGFEPNLSIHLEKNIPIGAGMGGGSSNSAAVILALKEIYNLKLGESDLISIGLEMGCDVPVCLNNKMALVQGVGEKLTSIKVNTEPPLCLIINPNKHLSTKDVFDALSIKAKKETRTISNDVDVIDFAKSRNNDLEAASSKIIPEIKIILNKLETQKNCLLYRMSGSGATCFGLFENDTDLDNAYQNFKKQFPNFYIKKSQLIYEKI
jgi:4-diphosphocytidyl-2-C-methyl-D-erythritol kinase